MGTAIRRTTIFSPSTTVSVVRGWPPLVTGTTPEGEAGLMKAQCLKRKLYPDDVAKVVVFLASEEAGACTSQQFIVDGGRV